MIRSFFLFLGFMWSFLMMAQIPVKSMGNLQVIGTQLSDTKGKPIRLSGVSYGWSCFHPRFYTKESVKWLKEDWKVNVVRAAMGIEPKDGYLDNPEINIKRIETVVDAAIKEGIYVIIDWHSHNIQLEEAKIFFDRMSKKYGKYPNVIYEIFNEPEYQSWADVKKYSEEVIEVIRKNDPDNIILVGCPEWDQRIDLVQKDPIKGHKNIMYTVHFYASTHKQWLRDRTDEAIESGIPVFISESAGMFANGDGEIDRAEWQRYIDWIIERNISWITWSVSDKDETCSLLLPTADSKGGWKSSDMKLSGNLIRDYLQYFDQRGNFRNLFNWGGRVEKTFFNKGLLIGAASYVEFEFNGSFVDVDMQSLDSFEHHNYVAIEVDGKYVGRLKIEAGNLKPYRIQAINKSLRHKVRITRATEASNGQVLIDLSKVDALPIPPIQKKRIEFIGDSITSGMGNDLSGIPCDQGEWYDQHNGYLAYGPVVARALDVDYLLSSVSGNGMYRNWNSVQGEETIFPEVYNNLYLNTSNTTPFAKTYQPDLVSIALGTNDLSDGDGVKERLKFNQHKYIGNYIEFVQNIFKRYPKTKVVLLNSPMVSGEKNAIFMQSLHAVKEFFKDSNFYNSISIFEFQEMTPKGCGYHPSAEDDQIMADQLIPFYQQILNQ